MRMTRLHVPTLKEVPRDAEIPSHRLLVRGGYIRRLAAGIYSYLPLAMRVIAKIERIVREELTQAGAQEVFLPAVQPGELWQESGRWDLYGPELLRFKDRKGASFCFGPTHEEVIVDLVRRDVRSWRNLPLNLFQIQVKFRDEMRPRAGLMRGREFIMKDAYSFDVDAAAANRSYDAMYGAYQRIFERCGLDFRAVEADTGAIGGSRSHEFQVLAESGEDAIVSCDTCDFAANVEQAELLAPSSTEPSRASEAMETVATPGVGSIEAVSDLLGLPPERFIKTLIWQTAEGKAWCVLIRGDHQLNELKLQRLLETTAVTAVEAEGIEALVGAPVGFVGPAGLDRSRLAGVLADHAIAGLRDGVSGANQLDAHRLHLDEGLDFQVDRFADLRLVVAGDACPRCEAGSLRAFRGIEVGHVFFLGTKYSEAMRCTYVAEDGEERPMVMGCYGIGVTRILSAAIEQRHDEHGICWPASIAPFQVSVLPLQQNREDVVAAAEQIYQGLLERGVEVLIDDRDERAGSKFKDADLIAAPWRIAIGGRGLKEGLVELKPRSGGALEKIPLGQAVEIVLARLGASPGRGRSR